MKGKALSQKQSKVKRQSDLKSFAQFKCITIWSLTFVSIVSIRIKTPSGLLYLFTNENVPLLFSALRQWCGCVTYICIQALK